MGTSLPRKEDFARGDPTSSWPWCLQGKCRLLVKVGSAEQAGEGSEERVSLCIRSLEAEVQGGGVVEGSGVKQQSASRPTVLC